MPAPSEQQTEPATIQDWGGFKLGMLSNQAYQRISQASADQLSVSRLETFFSVQGEQMQVAVMLWGAMIQSCPEAVRPSALEVGQWRAISRATNMPIEFDDNGLLKAANDG
ncbi:MAG: hypothetical protein AAGB19_09460 [Cyanobacteria bacterium P01_F01_bin.3]